MAAACGSRGQPLGTQMEPPATRAHSTSGSSTWPQQVAPDSCQTWGKSQNQPPMVNKTPWINHPPTRWEPLSVALQAQLPSGSVHRNTFLEPHSTSPCPWLISLWGSLFPLSSLIPAHGHSFQARAEFRRLSQMGRSQLNNFAS